VFLQATFEVTVSILIGGVTIASLLAVAKVLAVGTALVAALTRLIDVLRARGRRGRTTHERAVTSRKRRRPSLTVTARRAILDLLHRRTTKVGWRGNRRSQGADTFLGIFVASLPWPSPSKIGQSRPLISSGAPPVA
jgi:hypothetical protein